jgi:acyl-coenzyme A synthetase/AMP-(fatty) acid ligase
MILDFDNVRDEAVLGKQHNMFGQILVAKIVFEQLEAVESMKRCVLKACLAQPATFKVPAKVALVVGGLERAR